MKTILLDPDAWDLLLDAKGNIALADDPYATAQDVACAMRLFIGELWFNTKQGVPYFQQILGYMPPLALVKRQLEQAAFTVPGVTLATATITAFTDRTLSGQMSVVANGVTFVVAIPVLGAFTLDRSTLG